ncbi:hypothetical protein DL770_005129 [Monosporascus sp. CRB-9-2]|nr:hypothetical protein DL770_005129 [Monosporascus sp. CRB-9-2]
MASHILDIVPDVIREAALADEVTNLEVDFAPSASESATTYGSIPTELKAAYQSGNYNTIRDYADKAKSDIMPIYRNMQQRAERAFFKMYNDSDKRYYYMSISGPRSNPVGYMWCYCPDVTVGGTVQPAFTIGTYSVTSKTLGISNGVWDSNWVKAGASALAAVLAGFLGKFAFNRIRGMVINAAATAAAAATGRALVAAGVISGSFWASVAGVAAGLIVGAVVGAAAYFLVAFITDFVLREYRIAINIYNWDVRSGYIVTHYHADNGIFSGGGTFRKSELPIPGNTVRMPDGTVKPTPQTIYQYGEFVMENKNRIFQGVGAAFRILSKDERTGFQLKYDCPRFGGNRLAVTGGITQSVENYYKDSSSWAPAGRRCASSTIPISSVPILGTTTDLSGRDDRFYQFDVHIGLPPRSDFGELQEPVTTAPLEPTLEATLLPPPELPSVPSEGEEVVLPNGQSSKVIG